MFQVCARTQRNAVRHHAPPPFHDVCYADLSSQVRWNRHPRAIHLAELCRANFGPLINAGTCRQHQACWTLTQGSARKGRGHEGANPDAVASEHAIGGCCKISLLSRLVDLTLKVLDEARDVGIARRNPSQPLRVFECRGDIPGVAAEASEC
jgi:hypothetical protein